MKAGKKCLLRYIKQDIKDIAVLTNDIFYNLKAINRFLEDRKEEKFKKIRFKIKLSPVKNIIGILLPIIYVSQHLPDVDQQTKIALLILTGLFYPFARYSYKVTRFLSELEGINHLLERMFKNRNSDDLQVYAYDFDYNLQGNIVIKFYANVLPHTIENEKIAYCLGGEVVDRVSINNRAFKITMDEKTQNKNTDEYLKMNEGSLERLIEILKVLEIKATYTRTISNDIQDIHQFKFKGDLLNSNLKSKIAYMLAVKKNYLNIYNSEGLTNFVFNNKAPKIYNFFKVFTRIKRPNNMELPFLFGVNPQNGNFVIKDFRKILHLLIGGKSGQGKSNTLHDFVQSLMYWNDNISFYGIDLKGTEIKQYKDFSNFKYIRFDFMNEFKEFESGIDEIIKVFNDRFLLFEESEYRDIETYNKNNDKKLNYIIFVTDEANQYKVKLKKYPELYEKVDEITTLILRQGRSMGMHVIHTAQKVGDNGNTGYPSSWREDFTNVLSHNLKESLTAEKFFEEKSLIELVLNLKQGEFLYYDKDKSEKQVLKSCMIPLDNKDNLILETLKEYDKLKKIKMRKKLGGMNLEKVQIEKEI